MGCSGSQTPCPRSQCLSRAASKAAPLPSLLCRRVEAIVGEAPSHGVASRPEWRLKHFHRAGLDQVVKHVEADLDKLVEIDHAPLGGRGWRVKGREQVHIADIANGSVQMVLPHEHDGLRVEQGEPVLLSVEVLNRQVHHHEARESELPRFLEALPVGPLLRLPPKGPRAVHGFGRHHVKEDLQLLFQLAAGEHEKNNDQRVPVDASVRA